MGIREYIFDLITTDTIMLGLGFKADTTHTTHTLDTPQGRPMIVIRWQATVSGLQTSLTAQGQRGWPVNQRIMTVWVHEDKNVGDYTRIDNALKRLRTLFTSVEGVQVGDSSSWLLQIDWEGDSDDLRDDEAGTITRNAQFRLTGSAV